MLKTLLLCLFINSLFANEKISLQLQWKHAFQFAGYYMAKEKGYYDDIGLDVELKEYQYGMNVVDLVEQGTVTYGVGRPSIVKDKANGKDIILIAAIYQSSPLIVLTTKESGIKSIKDFKNKRIMTVNDSSNDAAINGMLRSQNLSLNDMKVMKHSFKLKDLIEGDTDFITAYIADQPFKLIELGYEPIVFHPSDYGFDFYSDILFTSNDELKNNYERVGDFKEASLKGWCYAFDNIEESIDIIQKKYNTQKLSRKALLYEAKELKKLAYYNTKEIGKIEYRRVIKILGLYNLMGDTNGKISLQNCIYIGKDNAINKITKEEQEYLKNKHYITMCIDPDWMPFEKFDKEGKHIGISREYFDIFEKELTIPIKIIKTNSWSQTLEFAKSRRCDIISMAMETKSRKQYMNFTTPYLNIPLVLATKDEISYIDDFRELNNKKIGLVEGYALVEILKDKYKNLDVIEVKSLRDGLEMVSNGELFGFAGSIADIGYIFQTSYIGNLKVTGKFDERWELGIAVRNDDLQLVNIFEKLAKGVSKSDQQRILNKYIAIKYEKGVDYTLLWKTSIGFIVALFILIFFLIRQNRLRQEIESLNANLELRINQEVDKNRQKDQTIFRQAKFVSMGEMIGNIAHQWRQPLNRLNLSLGVIDSIIKDEVVNKEIIINKIIVSQKNLQYMSNTIEDFANYFRPDKQMHKFNIVKTFQTVKELLNSRLDIIEYIYAKDDMYIQSYENELLQVLLVIVNNAIDNFEIQNTRNPKIEVNMKYKDNNVTIDIVDNGGGIQDENLDKIFEPYFTTKFKDHGTGIGLYMAKMIIEDSMDGKLIVHTSEDKTIFTIKLNQGEIDE